MYKNVGKFFETSMCSEGGSDSSKGYTRICQCHEGHYQYDIFFLDYILGKLFFFIKIISMIDEHQLVRYTSACLVSYESWLF